MKKLLVLASAVAVGFVVLVAATPWLIGLVTEDTALQYDDVDMRIAIEGTWRIVPDGGAPIEIAIRQGKASERHSSRGFIRSAAACSHHTFVRSAEACGDDAEMPLDVRIAGKQTDGSLRVFGYRFASGYLSVALDHDAYVTAQISPIGEASEVQYAARHATLVRISGAR